MLRRFPEEVTGSGGDFILEKESDSL